MRRVINYIQKMKITIIGAGAMGGATAEGILKLEGFNAGDLTVSDHNKPVLEHFASLGAKGEADNSEATKGADIVCVVVKPWHVEKTLKGIKNALDYGKQTLVVVAAGVSSADILTWMDKDGEVPQVVLAMPNIAIEYKASMTYLTPVNTNEANTGMVENLFNSLGETITIDEDHYKAATALSCSIAFAMRYARATIEGAVELGFKAKPAQKIVLQTMKGAVEFLQATGEHPESAIDRVTTPGGLTIRGLNEMEHNGFTSAVIKGLKASKV